MVHKIERYFTPAGENRRIHLYLPDDYDYSSERYPVLYMFDGHNLYFDWDATFGKSLGMKEFLDGWYKKLIVVGIECSDKDLQRVEEYCPYPVYSPAYGNLRDLGPATMDWICYELKPWVDETFRTWPQREATAIAGYSMGGLMTVFAILRYNHIFSKAAAISPSVNRTMDQFAEEMRTHQYDPDTRLFFSWGTDEYEPGENQFIENCIRSLEQMAMDKGIRTYLYCQPGGHHNEASWQYQVPTWMDFMWFN